MFISGLTLHQSRSLHISHPPDHNTRTSGDSYPFFPWVWDPQLTEEHTFCTSVIHTWHSPMGQPASDRGHHPCHEWARDWLTYQPWYYHERLHVNIGVFFSLWCSCSPRALSTRTREAFPLWWLWIRWHWHINWAHSFGILGLCEAENRLYSWIWWKPILGPKTWNFPFLCPVSQVDVTSVHSPTGLPWMRLVQAAANSKEQNLEAYLENSQLYYRSTRKINKNEELLVWYDEELSCLLGFNEIKAQSPLNGKYQTADCKGHWGLKWVCNFFSTWWSCNTGNKTCLNP